MRIETCEQGTQEWHELRQGIVTGTTLASALGSAKVQETLMYELISQRMTEPQIADIGSSNVKRGQELEPLAVKAAIEKTGYEFTTTGMLISEDIKGFGFSPDAVLMKDGVVVGGLETKCPTSKKHVEYLITGGVPKEYKYQVRAPFLMSDDIEFWVFASFDDRNYEKPLYLHTVEKKDVTGIEEDRQKLKEYLAKVEQVYTDLTF